MLSTQTTRSPGPDIAVIVPTYQEQGNVEILAARLAEVLGPQRYEIIFVDDNSPDGTAEKVRRLSREDARIRIIERIGRRGLSTAVIEGLLSTSAPYAVVIDGDMQHDERAIPSLIHALSEGADVAVGSRYIDGGGTGDWSQQRKQVSSLATRLSHLIPAARISDPMSGFMAVRTDVFRARAGQLVGTGYKILLDLLCTSGPPLKVREVAYVFRSRQQGESKLDARVTLEFAELLLAKSIGRIIPIRLLLFLMVGTIGVGIHFLALAILFRWETFGISQFGATMIAMTSNFLLNNVFTYRDKQLRGWRLLPGWLSFCAASSVGLIANTGVATYLYTSAAASWYVAALAGIAIGAAWNYISTSLFTWRS